MLHVKDAVSANIFAMNCEQNLNGMHYDVGTGENISLNEIRQIVKEYQPSVNFDYVAPRPNDVYETKADISGLETLGWTAKVDMLSGIRECFSGVLK